MSVKLLTEHHLEYLGLKGGCRGSSESTLVKMTHCLKSHDTAHLCYINFQIFYSQTQFRHSRTSDIYRNTHIVMAYSYADRNGRVAECSFKVLVRGQY